MSSWETDEIGRWFANDESLYELAKSAESPDELRDGAEWLIECPDGPLHDSISRNDYDAADWQSIHDDFAEDQEDGEEDDDMEGEE